MRMSGSQPAGRPAELENDPVPAKMDLRLDGARLKLFDVTRRPNTNPDITNGSIANPDITNPDITNPDITNPDITNPDITNPDITNLWLDPNTP